MMRMSNNKDNLSDFCYRQPINSPYAPVPIRLIDSLGAIFPQLLIWFISRYHPAFHPLSITDFLSITEIPSSPSRLKTLRKTPKNPLILITLPCYNSVMKLLPLSSGKSAQVDDEDYWKVAPYKWCAVNPQRDTWYAMRTRHVGEVGDRGTRLYLHREIIAAPPHSRVRIRDRNSLNCQKANLLVMPPSAASLAKKQAQKYILPLMPEGVIGEEAKRGHPLRDIYRDMRLAGRVRGSPDDSTEKGPEGGYLVRSYGSGRPAFFGVYKTIERAVSMRDAQEAARRSLGQTDPVVDLSALIGGDTPAADISALVGDSPVSAEEVHALARSGDVIADWAKSYE